MAMDLPTASFDALLCQQGFQFFPDKPAALGEMRRVLVPGRRVVLSVWKTAGPYTVAVEEALTRYVSAEAAARYGAASRMVPEAEDLHSLFIEAGFRAVHICPSVMTIRLPPIEAFVLCHLAATPVAGAVAALSEEGRLALARQVSRALQAYTDGEGVAIPNETNIVTAHT
jgi:SAM-dependent methyltransferase